MGLRDADALWEALAPHRARVRHLFHGHLHRPIAGSWRGIPLSSLRGTAFAVSLDQRPGQVAVSHREAPCYALARASGEDLVVHTVELPDARRAP
jgi:3',5'-cyclic AMP phosphodiesterase CpdA